MLTQSMIDERDHYQAPAPIFKRKRRDVQGVALVQMLAREMDRAGKQVMIKEVQAESRNRRVVGRIERLLKWFGYIVGGGLTLTVIIQIIKAVTFYTVKSVMP